MTSSCSRYRRAITASRPISSSKARLKAIEFYKKAFGATELFRMPGPGDQIMHAEIKIGDSPVMMADEFPDMGYKSPQSYGGTPVSNLHFYVPNVDAVFNQAIAAGGKELRPLQDEFYGDRSGSLGIRSATCGRRDPRGRRVARGDERRAAQAMQQQGGG